jgi:hypothetical protein
MVEIVKCPVKQQSRRKRILNNKQESVTIEKFFPCILNTKSGIFNTFPALSLHLSARQRYRLSRIHSENHAGTGCNRSTTALGQALGLDGFSLGHRGGDLVRLGLWQGQFDSAI